MKKTIKRIFLSLGIVVLLIILLFVGYMLKAKSEIKSMNPINTGLIAEDIYAVQDMFSNLFLIKDSSSYILIDAGNTIDIVEDQLKSLGIDPNDVSTVFLTHTDGDHVGGLSLFKNAKVYLSSEEEKLLNGEASRFLFFGNHIAASEYGLINDQDEIQVGNIIVKGILNSGHTIGSMSFLINDKYLFTGDAIGLKDNKIVPFNKFFNSDTDKALESMSKINNISSVEYIFTAHHGYVQIK